MKISIHGLLRLKPFDESADGLCHEKEYRRSPLMAAGIVIGAALAVLSLILVIVGSEWGLKVLLLAVAVSAVTAGFEWHAGMKARALNQLFMVGIIMLAMLPLNH